MRTCAFVCNLYVYCALVACAWWQYENDPDSDSETTSPSIGGREQNNGEQPLFSIPSFMHQGTGAFDPVKFVSLARNYRVTGICVRACVGVSRM